MRAHIIEDNKVANTIIVDSLDAMPNLIDASNGGQIGDLYDGETFTAPPLYASVEEGQAAKIEEIKQSYQSKLKQGCTLTAGYSIDCEPNNVTDFAQTLQLMEASGNESATTTIRDYSNTLHTDISITAMKAICLELGNYITTLRTSMWAKIDQVTALTDVAAIEAFNTEI